MIRWHRRRQIDAYLAEGAGAADPSLWAHLRGCEACQRYFDEGAHALRAVRGGAAGAGEQERIAARAVAALPGMAPPRTELPPRATLVGALGLALAAAVVIALWPGTVGRVASVDDYLVVDGVRAVQGQRLKEGAQVRAVRGNALLMLEGGRQILLREEAELRLRGDDEVQLLAGRARFEVRKRGGGPAPFAVRVDEVRVEVRGTIFVVEQRRDDLLVAVHTGEVQVRTPGSAVSLGAGQETSVAEGVVRPARPATRRSLDEDRGGGDVLDRVKRRAGQLYDDLLPR